MQTIERTLEEFDVSSADGQRVRVRKTLMVHELRNPDGPDQPCLKLSRAIYAGLARGGLERPVEALGDDKFRIAGIEFTRIH